MRPERPRLVGRRARLARLDRHDWSDFAIAVAELALARVTLAAALDPAGLAPASGGRPDSRAIATAERVALAIAQASRRVPWRSDCLVQAKAARNWLMRLGIESVLNIGVRTLEDGRFDAHAWLQCGPARVTGGEVRGYSVLKSPTARQFQDIAPHVHGVAATGPGAPTSSS